jgi:Cdc6-like AAA superfamily ATPase
MEGDPAATSLLVGPSGAGKTCVARYTVNELREKVLDLNTAYVNCWSDYSQFKVLYRLLDAINQSLDIHRRSTPTDELLERLREYDGPRFVVILDEVDQLENKGLLYDLNRLRGLDLVLIANDEKHLFAGMDDRVQSRLSTVERVRFNQYAITELEAILSDRVRWGLAEDAIHQQQVRTIADAAAGDARQAIGILRNAARAAERAGLDAITDDVIEDAIPTAKNELRQADLERLNEHQETLYELIQAHGPISPGDLYEHYEAAVESPKTKRTMRNYLGKMQHYNLVKAEGQARDRTYHPVR